MDRCCPEVQPPVGFWDPLGLSADGDVTVFKRRREVELKHGRSRHMCFTNFDITERSHSIGSLIYTHTYILCLDVYAHRYKKKIK